MTSSQLAALKRCTISCIGKDVWFKYKGTPERYLLGTVEDVVSVIVSDYNHMIQRIKLSPATARAWGSGHTYAYRTCYYTLSAKKRVPVWGQYHALIPASDFRKLAQKANRKGWLGSLSP